MKVTSWWQNFCRLVQQDPFFRHSLQSRRRPRWRNQPRDVSIDVTAIVTHFNWQLGDLSSYCQRISLFFQCCLFPPKEIVQVSFSRIEKRLSTKSFVPLWRLIYRRCHRLEIRCVRFGDGDGDGAAVRCCRHLGLQTNPLLLSKGPPYWRQKKEKRNLTMELFDSSCFEARWFQISPVYYLFLAARTSCLQWNLYNKVNGRMHFSRSWTKNLSDSEC